MNLVSVIFDANIYLDFWIHRKHQEKMDWASRRYLVRQSSVVLHELRRGVRTKRGLKWVTDLHRNSPKIYNPLPDDWWQAAEVISRLSRIRKWNPEQRMSFQNDSLIALTCRRYGQLLITSNQKDFDLLRSHVDFQVMYW